MQYFKHLQGIAGGIGGLLYASIKGKNKPAHMLYMSVNWTMAAIPFYITRQSILEYRKYQNQLYSRSNFEFKNVDDMVSSTGSGFLLGLGLGYIWSTN